jgi:prolyl-tRNA editing enzyme YbaK/EbsC (Cys-tRNA(Pro) deacylase)
MTPWPEPVERVAAYLRAAGAEARLEEFAEGASTAKAAAEAIGCGLDEIVKSLVFLCDGAPVVALVPGDRRGDPAKVARAAGATATRIARPEEVEAATGFSPGAVAPFPLLAVQRVFVEQTLLTQPVLWVGAGSTRHMARLTASELLRLTRAEAADVVQDAYDLADPRAPTKER